MAGERAFSREAEGRGGKPFPGSIADFERLLRHFVPRNDTVGSDGGIAIQIPAVHEPDCSAAAAQCRRAQGPWSLDQGRRPQNSNSILRYTCPAFRLARNSEVNRCMYGD
jgi:hypothetical protein